MPENESAKSLAAKLTELFLTADEQEGTRLKSMRSTCIGAFKYAFEDKNSTAWQVYTLCDNDIGVFANIMQANAQRMSKLLKQVQSFEYIPNEVVAKLLINNCEMPSSFYETYYLNKNNLIENLALNEEVFIKIAQLESEDAFSSIKKLVFYISICREILRQANWVRAKTAQNSQQSNTNFYKEAFKIAMLYKNMAITYFGKVYNKDFLQREDEHVTLPTEHYTALILISVFAAHEKGDKLKFVRQLKKLLQADKMMYATVKMLTENLDITKKQYNDVAVSNELIQLAEKIKLILNNLDENSPEAKAILDSEAYKAIKHML